MEIVVCFFGLQNSDISPHIAIDGVPQLVGRKPSVQMNIGHLPLGMNSGVGATGPGHLYIGIFDHAYHTLELALCRPFVFLHLPAVTIGAVCFNMTFVIPLIVRILRFIAFAPRAHM